MSQIEKAILRTLIYSDLFGFPLKGWEVQKWLIRCRADLNEVEQALEKMVKKGLIVEKQGYFCLVKRKRIIGNRIKNLELSEELLERAGRVLAILRLVPWIKLVGISGGLAMGSVDKKADIDVFFVTQQGRLWVSRLIILGYLEVLGLRRKRQDDLNRSAGLICSNTLLDNANLAQSDSNLYLAHEVLQLRILWQKEDTYQQFLESNLWAFDWLPNWRSGEMASRRKKQKKEIKIQRLDWWERMARLVQLVIMQRLSGEERVSDGALYFQPFNYQNKVLDEYRQRLKSVGLRFV